MSLSPSLALPVDAAAPAPRLSFSRSTLTRRIVLVNLAGLLIVVAGALSVSYLRDGLVQERERALLATASMLVGVVGDSPLEQVAASLARLPLSEGERLAIFDPSGRPVTAPGLRPAGEEIAFARPALAEVMAGRIRLLSGHDAAGQRIVMVVAPLGLVPGLLPGDHETDASKPGAADPVSKPPGLQIPGAEALATGVAMPEALRIAEPPEPGPAVVVPPLGPGLLSDPTDGVTTARQPTGALILASGAGEIDLLLARERLQLLRLVVLAALVSLGLSLVLASAIATPLARLAAAAEAGRSGGRSGPARVRIPDLGHRSDEIGRLSAALRTMVGTLYQRLEANEQFAADVSHELKNPLASLRSAVSTMRVMTREEQRERLIAIIEHDVRRLDRLVTDIASASRLDSELVREEEAELDLSRMITGLCDHFRTLAGERGILLTCDLPSDPVLLRGLEARLAQVFVNLIANALSFCEAGDAIRVWCRQRDGRVLVVVEDTGPGIPAESLPRIFDRFYSERPAGQFGEHSGLGLSISRQIVEAHGGVIWAENVEPSPEDPGSDPMGARFVVGLRG